MTTPDAEDASPSPEYSGDQEGSEMAEQKIDRASSDASPSQQTGNGQKSSSNAKDPLRPRRKKARRACYACQRAHLTCGDERPCNRCIKRGIQNDCMDGVRKKAKYLHDAPDGALMPGVGGSYPHINGTYQGSLPGQVSAASLAQQSNLYNQAQPNSFNIYGQSQHGQNQQGQMTPVQDGPVMPPFGNQQAPISPPYSQGTQQTPIQNMSNPVTQPQPFGGPLFDPSDPALFNFDIASLNFGNHYGALEFGMLGHMSSGAADTPPNDNNIMNPLNQAAGMYNPPMSTGGFTENSAMTGNMFGPDGLPNSDWQNTQSQSRQGSIAHVQTPNNTPNTVQESHANRHDSVNGLPPAYAIGQGPSSLSSASPASTADVTSGLDSDNPMSSATFFANANSNQSHMQRSPSFNRPPQNQQNQQSRNNQYSNALQPIQSNVPHRKRPRDTSWIYDGIKEPHPYSKAFHRLREVVGARFPPDKARKVAHAIAAFRPTLIVCGMDLDRNDLIHGEKNLQRQLLTLEGSIEMIGTPTVVFRRTGEVVFVGKEFSILTGWQREVLLGKEQNFNVNFSSNRDPAESGNTSRSGRTPVLAGQEPDNGPHPVSIAELLDEDSVVQFYEDLSRLAFGDTHSTIKRRVRVLKYRTQEDLTKLEELNSLGHGVKQEQHVKLENHIHSEAGMGMLGAKDGSVDCMIGWHVRRDNFDLPMLIIMNLLPVLL